jgi:predicted phosphodiesterase
MKKLRKVLEIPDSHIPSEDKRAYKLCLKAWDVWQPDVIIIMGDFANCGSVSPHAKMPGEPFSLKVEIDAVNARLDQIDALGAGEKHFIQGNHEYWIERYLGDRAPEIAEFEELKLERLLRLKERGWTYTPYKRFRQVGKIYYTHEAGNSGPNAHIQAGKKFEDNVAIGHTHRLAVSYSGNARGKSHVSRMLGWLGDIEKVDYAHRIQTMSDWHLGFGTGYLEGNGVLHSSVVPIINYSMVLEGQLFRG